MLRVRTVFISSSRTVLRKERKAVRDVGERLGTFVLRMEVCGAASEAPLKRSLAMVRKSDAVVILVGSENESQSSEKPEAFLELEYEEAVKRQIPTFVFFSTESPLASSLKESERRKGVVAALGRLAREATDVLAEVASDPEDAKIIAVRAGFPREHLPEFKKPISFWSKVVDQSARGRVALDALLGEAARQFPHNREIAGLKESATKFLAHASLQLIGALSTSTPQASPSEARPNPPGKSPLHGSNPGPLTSWQKRLLRERTCESFSGVKELQVKVAISLARWMMSNVAWYQRPIVLVAAILVAAPGWLSLAMTWWLSAKGAIVIATIAGLSTSLALQDETVSSEGPTTEVPIGPKDVTGSNGQTANSPHEKGDAETVQELDASTTTEGVAGDETTGSSIDAGSQFDKPAQIIVRIQEGEKNNQGARQVDVTAQRVLRLHGVKNVLSKQAKALIWRAACSSDMFYDFDHPTGVGEFIGVADSIAADDAIRKKGDDADESMFLIASVLSRLSGIPATRPGYKNFTHWNPEIVLWIAQHLLPGRKKQVCPGISAEMLYGNTVLPFMRGAAAVLIFHAKEKPMYPKETVYSLESCNTGICEAFDSDEDGKFYARATAAFFGGEDGSPSKWGFLRDDWALDEWNHFWIRRCLDGTMDEFAALLSLAIHRYDFSFVEYHGKDLRDAVEMVGETECAGENATGPIDLSTPPTPALLDFSTNDSGGMRN